MKKIFIIIPEWETDTNECFVVEYFDETEDEPTVELLFVDKVEYKTIFEMIKLVWQEQKILSPQNQMPI